MVSRIWVLGLSPLFRAALIPCVHLEQPPDPISEAVIIVTLRFGYRMTADIVVYNPAIPAPIINTSQ